jgi:hypothetical protein
LSEPWLWVRSAVCVLELLMLTGCSKSAGSVCTPGQVEACPACPQAGDSGSRACSSRGTWDPCQCHPVPSDAGSLPDAAPAAPADAAAGEAGTPSALGCRPTTCYREHKNCDSIPSGCNKVLNCGVCPAPQTCGLTVANVCGPVPSVLVGGRNHPWKMISDGTTLFWIDYGTYTDLYPPSETLPANGPNASVLAMNRAGGPVTVLASAQVNARGIAVDGTNVYFTTQGMPGAAVGTVWSVPKAGGQAPTAIATKQIGPNGVAVDDTYVWWVNSESHTGLMRVLKAGGTPEVVVAGTLGNDIVLDESNVYWTVIVVPSVQSADIAQVSKLGGTLKVIVQGLLNPGALLVDGGKLYWVDDGNVNTSGRVMSFNLATQIKTEMAVRLNGPRSLAIDANNIYWTEFGDWSANTTTGKVMALPLVGGKPLSLAVGLNHPAFLVLDGTGLVISLHGQLSVNTDRGQILSLPRFW